MGVKHDLNTSHCKKLFELPPVVTDWQQVAWCPDCESYDHGRCDNPLCKGSNAACPFDGKALPLREVAVEAPNAQPGKLANGESRLIPRSWPSPSVLEQTIQNQITNWTGGRMQTLGIELTDCELIVRGSAPSYYVKQLALRGVLDVLLADQQIKIECNFQVLVQSRQSHAECVQPG
jgi:hypothetical protein